MGQICRDFTLIFVFDKMSMDTIQESTIEEWFSLLATVRLNNFC